MSSCAPGDAPKVCWFCKKGRHSECMIKMPVDAKSDGPHDCAFDNMMVQCTCCKQDHKVVHNE